MSPQNIVLITEREEHFKDLGWEKFQPLYEALEEIDQYEEIQYDSETTGLNSFMKEKVNAFQIGVPGKQYVFDAHTIKLQVVKDILESKLVLGHNIGFDLPYVFQAGIVPTRIYDTQIAETVLNLGMEFRPGREKTLEACLWRHCGIKIDKTEQKNIDKGLISVDAIIYSANDVRYLFELRDAQMVVANQRQLQVRIAFENRYIPAHCYLEFSGVMVDKPELNKWIRGIEAEETIILKKLIEEYGDINWASGKQVGEKLKEYGIEHIKEETGNLETNQDILDKYDLPITKDLSTFREIAKMVSTYGRKWYSYIMPDGRIHTKYKQLVDTGRTACGKVDRRKMEPWDLTYESKEPFPNMQNLPKKREGMRDVFIPKKGNVLIVADYSGQESVILADQSEDPAMLKLFGVDKADPHCFVVRLAYPELAELSDDEIKEKHGAVRDIIKTGAFAIAYGGNGRTIADNIGCTVEEGDYIYESYMKAFPGLGPFFKHCYEFAWKRNYMPTDALTGGKRFFDRALEYADTKNMQEYWRRYYAEKEEETEWYLEQKEKMGWYRAMTSALRKESVNTRIQGTGAVMSKLAMIYFFDWILSNKLFGKVLMPIFVHDELVAECHARSAEKVAAALQECMERSGRECLKHLTIKADAKICTKWEK